jgi:hypothetical protein
VKQNRTFDSKAFQANYLFAAYFLTDGGPQKDRLTIDGLVRKRAQTTTYD